MYSVSVQSLVTGLNYFSLLKVRMYKYLALSSWWDRHNKSFSTWYLTLPAAVQEALLLNACPDMPRSTPGSREMLGIPLVATDMLLPELSLEALMTGGGKLLVLLLARRLVTTDGCLTADIKLLEECYKRGHLPVCYTPETVELLNGLDTPFVDPTDVNESIKSLTPLTSPAVREELLVHFETGRLVRAEVWIAMKIRKSSLEDFCECLILEHEGAISPKLSPSYKSLLKAEKDLDAFVVVDSDASASASEQFPVSIPIGAGPVPAVEPIDR